MGIRILGSLHQGLEVQIVEANAQHELTYKRPESRSLFKLVYNFRC